MDISAGTSCSYSLRTGTYAWEMSVCDRPAGNTARVPANIVALLYQRYGVFFIQNCAKWCSHDYDFTISQPNFQFEMSGLTAFASAGTLRHWEHQDAGLVALPSASAATGGRSVAADPYAWERAYERPWESIQEDESGLLKIDAQTARRAGQRYVES